jgi:hypothetical protein
MKEGEEMVEKVSKHMPGGKKLKKVGKDAKNLLEDIVPSVPHKKPFKVDIGQRTKDLRDSLKASLKKVPEMLEDIPELVVKVPEKIGEEVEHLGKEVEHLNIPGMGFAKRTAKKVWHGIEKIPKTIEHTLLHPCSLVHPRDSSGRTDAKGDPIHKPKLHMPKIHPPKICGIPATTVAKDVALFPVKIGHSMIDGVKHGAKNAKHLITGILPTFVWPIDGKCPIAQRGGACRTRRRRRRRKKRTRRRRTRRRRTRRRRTRRRRTRRRQQRRTRRRR